MPTITPRNINDLLISQFDIIIYLSIMSAFIGVLNGIKSNIDDEVEYPSYTFFYNIARESFVAIVSVPFFFFLLVVFLDPFLFGVLFSSTDRPTQYLSNIVYALFSLLFARELMKWETWLSLLKFGNIVIVKILLKWRK